MGCERKRWHQGFGPNDGKGGAAHSGDGEGSGRSRLGKEDAGGTGVTGRGPGERQTGDGNVVLYAKRLGELGKCGCREDGQMAEPGAAAVFRVNEMGRAANKTEKQPPRRQE